MHKNKTYYEKALEYAGKPYNFKNEDGIKLDCSGLINAATGMKKRVWWTSLGAPTCGEWIKINATSLEDCKEGDLLLFNRHVGFYGGGERMFHAQKTGTLIGYTNDLKIYWLKSQNTFPQVFRQKF